MDALSRIGPSTAPVAPVVSAANVAGAGNTGPEFTSLIDHGIARLDSNVSAAEQTLVAYSLGDAIPTQDLMIAMERARFALQFAVEVRNRLGEAYGEIMRMQI